MEFEGVGTLSLEPLDLELKPFVIRKMKTWFRYTHARTHTRTYTHARTHTPHTPHMHTTHTNTHVYTHARTRTGTRTHCVLTDTDCSHVLTSHKFKDTDTRHLETCTEYSQKSVFTRRAFKTPTQKILHRKDFEEEVEEKMKMMRETNRHFLVLLALTRIHARTHTTQTHKCLAIGRCE